MLNTLVISRWCQCSKRCNASLHLQSFQLKHTILVQLAQELLAPNESAIFVVLSLNIQESDVNNYCPNMM